MFYNINGLSLKINEKGFAILSDGDCFFDVPVGTSVCEGDTDINVRNLDIKDRDGEIVAEWECQSSLWNKKVYTLRLTDDGVLYTVTVEGKGKVGYTEFFNGANTNEDSNFGVDFDTKGYWNPQIQSVGAKNKYYEMFESSAVGVNTFSPSITCFAFDMQENENIVGIGAAPQMGNYNFRDFDYNFKGKYFTLAIDFADCIDVDGEYILPGILFVRGDDNYSVYKNYRDWLIKYFGYPVYEVNPPRWWHGPIFCGWGDQWALSDTKDLDWGEEFLDANIDVNEKRARRDVAVSTCAKCAANEKNYRLMTDELEKKNIDYTAVIIDDKWETQYGTFNPAPSQWPDLRAYTDDMHKKGKKVLLWMNTWDCEGVDEDMCITLDGKKISVDPTNPKYVEHLENCLRRVLSDEEGCYNADGFKVDFANGVVHRRGARIYEKNVSGIELSRRHFENIYKISKSIKPDAIITHSNVHPYFADIIDVVRLHDYFPRSNSSLENMATRASVARCAFGDNVLIDTDAPGGFRRRDTLVAVKHQSEYGIPSLYGVLALYDFFDDEDWAEISRIYRKYSKKKDEEYGI